MRTFFESRYFRHTLGVAGMVNIIAGILFCSKPSFYLYLFYNEQNEVILSSPSINSNLFIMFGFIFIIGFGLLWAMKNPVENKLMILICGIGKTFASLVWALNVVQEIATNLTLLPIVSDLSLGILFIVFYISIARKSSS